MSVLIPVLMSGNGVALVAAGALGALELLPGCVAATLLRTRDRLVAWVVGSAYGLAPLALIGAGLGRVDRCGVGGLGGADCAGCAHARVPCGRSAAVGDLAGGCGLDGGGRMGPGAGGGWRLACCSGAC
ncbi:MAG: hypothetical protein U0232_04155 [Thermomicrobiales bacterium]